MWFRVSVCMLLAIGCLQSARGRFIVGAMTFQEMLRKADLVVIATELKTKDTGERKKLIDIDANIHTTAPEQLQDEVIGVQTEFLTRVILKGPKGVTKFLLHHYRPTWNEEEVANGPNLIPSNRHGTFLMFLAKEKDGRYAPVTGQFDPAVLSVFEIKEATSETPVEED